MFRSKTAASFATKIAHTSTLPALGNKDLRLLQDVIINEKAILTTMQKLAIDFAKASESLKSWGIGEGEDLSDILTNSASIFGHLSAALNNYANHEHSIRAHLKTIRTREEKLDELKRKRKNVASKADAADKKLSKMSGENKNLPTQTVLLNQLRDEIRQLDTEIVIEETKLSDFKRLCTRNFMALKFGGLLELGEKATIIGELGKLLIEEIPLDPTPPGQPRVVYQSHTKTAGVVDEVSRCIDKVVFNPGPEAQISADVYAPSSMLGGARPSDEASSPVDAYPSQYHVTNYGDTTRSTMQSYNTGPPTNEFGESLTSSRRFGSQVGPGYNPGGPDGSNGGAGGGGGQFNTFPIKNRPPALAAPEVGRDSFGVDVTTALRYVEGESASAPAPEEQHHDAYNGTRSVIYTDEDSHLPYARPSQPEDERNNDMAAPQSGVRFRTPSMEVSGRSPISPGVDSPTRATSGMGGTGVARRSRRKVSDAGETFTDLDVPEEVGEDEEEHAGHVTYEHDGALDETARNAAAAREIALEMEKLEFPMPPISPLSQQPEASPPPETHRYSQYSAVQIPEPQLYSPQQEQQQQQQQSYYSQVNTQPLQYTPQPLSARRTPSPLTQGATPSPESGGSIPYRTESPQIPPSSPIVSSPTQPPAYSTTTPFYTPTASSTSIPTVGGPRTITAAAFKRGGKDGDPNRKRFLPISPRPSIDSGSNASPGPETPGGSPYQQGLPAALTPGNPSARVLSREPSSPTTGMDYGALGHIRIANATGDE